MDTLEFIRITDTSEAAEVAQLGREYTDWLVAAFAEEHNHEVPGHVVNHIPHLEADSDVILDDRGRLYLGVINGEPAAIGMLKPVTETLCEGKRLYVRPEFRGRGFGRQMLERLMTDARDIGYTQMRAEVSLLMREGLALYRTYDPENLNEHEPFEGHEGEAWGTTQHQVFMTYDIPAEGPAISRKL